MDNAEKFLKHLKEAHNGDLRTFFKAYGVLSSFKKSKSVRIAVVITVFIQVLLLCSEGDLYEFLSLLIAKNLSIIPNVLGFAIGAYALLISGFSEKLLARIVLTEEYEETAQPQFNSFQKTSAIFGMALFVMSIGLLLNYTLSIINDTNFFNAFSMSIISAKTVNSIIIFLLNLVSIYSILLIFNSVINLFAFSQFISAIMTLDKNESDQ
ncbi:hypothetical protein [Sphingobacterium athyrii]|uniref:Uncharacterized protein n=1 Tax=Sphingobacterium athyrii TaxID=2152717 RepID=A0A363NUR8_9SPHI|nr:hypothetical protein [Sphingobacterium athyrii]PUV24534.1 hypothetical protein DCO56_14425 [Sphingobacterium athyrii]